MIHVNRVLQAAYQERVDPNDKQAQSLLEEMRAHIKKVQHRLRYVVMCYLLKAFPACLNIPNRVCAARRDAQE